MTTLHKFKQSPANTAGGLSGTWVFAILIYITWSYNQIPYVIL